MASSIGTKIRKLVVTAALGALAVFLGMTRLGFFPWFTGASITVLHIPAIIGAILEGPFVGAGIGAIFGIFSLIQANVAPLTPIDLAFREQYRNMAEILAAHPKVMGNLLAAVRQAGLEPHIKPIRGGTDGARLSFMGLPTPNVFTGGYNYHGRYEWVSLDGMNQAAEVLVNLVRKWAE